MATQWSVVKAEIQAWVEDDAFASGGDHESYLLTWANRVINDVCVSISIPNHLSSGVVSFTTGSYSASLPSNFLKLSRRHIRVTTNTTVEGTIGIVSLAELDGFDIDHDDTTTNDYPSYVAIEGEKIYAYPLFTGDLNILNYYRKPSDMTGDTSTPDLPSKVAVVDDIIISGVCVSAYRWLREKELMGETKNIYNEFVDKLRLHLDAEQFIRRGNAG